MRHVFCSVAATTEDELVEGADLLQFLDGEEICASGIGVRIVLGMGSNSDAHVPSPRPSLQRCDY